MKYSKYFRKTSLKQKGHGETFLKEVLNKKPKSFLEIGVFHGVTARNVCELLYKIHGNDFKYVGLDLFEKSDENKFEVIPSTNFKNPFKKFYHQYIMRQDPYSIEGVSNLLKKFKNQISEDIFRNFTVFHVCVCHILRCFQIFFSSYTPIYFYTIISYVVRRITYHYQIKS